jgi:hypothetical protein
VGRQTLNAPQVRTASNGGCGVQSTTFGVHWLFFPHSFDEFKTSVFEVKPWHLAREAPSYYFTLIDSQEVGSLIAMASHLDLASVKALSFDSKPVQCLGFDDARSAYNQGKTIRIIAAHRFSTRLRTFCSSLEMAFGTTINANLYSSPAGAQALRKHFDWHDVLVIQLEGRKRWRLYSSPIAVPFDCISANSGPSHRMRDWFTQTNALASQRADTMSIELVLAPGDLLYIPRGHVHEARAEVSSHHLTIGLTPNFTPIFNSESPASDMSDRFEMKC